MHNMHTLCGTVLRSFPEFGITLIVMERLDNVKIFDFHMARHD